MNRKKNDKKINFEIIVIASFIGVVLYIIFTFVISMLTLKNCITPDCWKWLSKFSLLAAVLAQCIYVRQKGRGVVFTNTAASAIISFLFIASVSYLCAEKTSVTISVTCFALCLLISYLLSIPKTKNSKLHKRRKIVGK